MALFYDIDNNLFLKADNASWYQVKVNIVGSAKSLRIVQTPVVHNDPDDEYAVIDSTDGNAYKFQLVETTSGGATFITSRVTQTPSGEASVASVALIGTDGNWYALKLRTFAWGTAYFIDGDVPAEAEEEAVYGGGGGRVAGVLNYPIHEIRIKKPFVTGKNFPW